jgi:flap endonuclease-1
MGVKNLMSLLNQIIDEREKEQNKKNINYSLPIRDNITKKYSIDSDSKTIENLNQIEYFKNDCNESISTLSDTSINTDISIPINTKKKFSDLKDKKIAIDASLLIYQYVIGIRNTSTDLTTVDGKFTSHIHAVVSKTLLYLDNNITPIFVFDGKPPEMKSGVLVKRREDRIIANALMKDTTNIDEKTKLFKKSTIITYKQMDECKEILRAMGIPVIESEAEADSQLAYLTKTHDVYGAGSEDMDILAFGAKKLLKNISSSKKNEIIEYDLCTILSFLELSMSKFINLCILLGCDYVEPLNHITPYDAYKIILKHGTIPTFLSHFDSKVYHIPENYRKQCVSAYKYFQDCPHKIIKKEHLERNDTPDKNIIRNLLIKYSYSRTKIDKIITKLDASKKNTFFEFSMIRSNRKFFSNTPVKNVSFSNLKCMSSTNNIFEDDIQYIVDDIHSTEIKYPSFSCN